MEQELATIKSWLGTGSINIFGLPMSGKDTQGIKLAEALNAKFISSGMIIRAMEAETKNSYSKTGNLIPSNLFYQWVLPYLERPDLFGFPLILSSIGRWNGEEKQVLSIAAAAGHEIKAAIILDLSPAAVKTRFEAAKTLKDRGDRQDDQNPEIFENRIKEFNQKTVPVLNTYNALSLLVRVNGNQSRNEVFNEIVEKLYQKASQSPA